MRQSGFVGNLLGGAALLLVAVTLAAQPAQPKAGQQPQPKGQVEPVQPVQPVQPPSPAAPTTVETGGLATPGGLFGSVGGGSTAAPAPDAGGGAAAAPTAAQQQQVQSTPSSIVGGGEAVSRGTTDVGDLLGKSLSSLGVQVQRRNPIVSEPRIRGYQGGQITTIADGAYWFPARPDLDTIVSKLDSSLISNIVVIKGPYSVRHGYGFSFLDVETLPTPRYDHGWETHGSSSIRYKHNGEGWNARQAVWGGDADWGFRAGWDVLTGNDYFDGDHVFLPSSYNSQNFDFAVGAHLTDILSVEFKFFRLHQRNIEFPGVVTDINRLITDALNLRFVWDDPSAQERMTFDMWFNETRFNGDNLRPGKRRQIPQLDDFDPDEDVQGLALNIETNGDANSWGGRHAMTWGAVNAPQLTVGYDFRYISQAINELDTFFLPEAQGSLSTNFPVPRSRQLDPGVFIDAALPVGEQFVFKAGSRVDFVSARIQQPLTFPDPGGPTNLLDPNELGPNAFDTQHYDLVSAFTTGEYKLTKEVSFLAGYGYAQRAPTLVELFADGPFLALLQNGFTFVKGQPNLSEEQLHQVDLGMRANYERYRGGASAFCSWINDYITYDLESKGTAVAGFNGYRYKNTGLATLIGGEFYSEYDVLDWLTPFGVISYVEGRDHDIEEPLPGIYPLESRVGVRVHDPDRSPRWAVEFTTRMVASQDRVATSLLEVPTGGFTIFDLRSYWLVRDNVLLTGGVENIGDRLYREHLDLRTGRRGGVFQPGVNIYVGMRVTY